jgi:hypothetical protein
MAQDFLNIQNFRLTEELLEFLILIENSMKISVSIIILLFFTGCDLYPGVCNKSSHKFIVIKNNSSKELYFNVGLLNLDNNISKIETRKVSNFSEKKYYLIQNLCWEESFKSAAPIKPFYFYDSFILENNKWEDVVKNNLGILDSIRVDLDYLQKNNWTVTYPK